MTKKILALTAMLAAMLAAAVPAMAQEETSVTGVLFEQEGFTEETYYGLTEDVTGETYPLTGDAGTDFSPYLDQRVTVYGAVSQSGNEFGRVLKVSRVEPAEGEAADGGYTVEEREINFELAIEGEPPADATFSGSGPLVGLPAPLADEDGDGTYTGTATVEVTVNPDGTTQPAPVAIYGGIGTAPSGDPGEPFAGATEGLVLEDFGAVVLEDGQTLSGSYSFGEGEETTVSGGTTTTGGGTTTMGGGTTTAVDSQYEDGGGTPEAAGIDLNQDGAVDAADGEFAVQTSEAGAEATPEEGALPDTGGVLLPLAGAALLLAVGGLLARRATR